MKTRADVLVRILAIDERMASCELVHTQHSIPTSGRVLDLSLEYVRSACMPTDQSPIPDLVAALKYTRDSIVASQAAYDEASEHAAILIIDAALAKAGAL